MSNEEQILDKFLKDYANIRSLYENFTESLFRLFETILKKNNIRYHVIEKRTKTIDSYKEKINRKHGNYVDPVNQMSDLTGLRIILYYADDVDKVYELLKNEFEIIETIDKRQTFDLDQFGYLSVHSVIRIKKERGSLVDWIDYKSFKAEIQIRSILQHAWAMISHALIYKKESEAPKIIQRKLNRLSGLFEIADDYFINLRNSEQNVTLKIDKSIKEDVEKVDIDLISISRFSNSKEVEGLLIELGEKANVPVYAEPHENCYRILYYVVKLCNINSIKELRASLNFDYKKVNKYFTEIDSKIFEAYCIQMFLSLLLLGFKANKVDKKDLIAIGIHKSLSEKIVKYSYSINKNA